MKINNPLSFVITALIPITLSGCIGAEKPTFQAGPFTAKYYIEDDGTNAGQGTDGSNPEIIPSLIAEEEAVDRVAINYSWSDFNSINSYNFHGVWEGDIAVTSESETINASFDASWSDVSFYLDGTLLSKWSNSNKVIPLTLAKGNHPVRIEYHNHWHTTGFNVSFTNTQKSTVAEATDLIQPRLTDQHKILYISAYESGTINNDIKVSLPASSDPVVIFLTSYAAVNWVINNPSDTNIEGIFFNAYSPKPAIIGGDNASTYETVDMKYGYEEGKSAKEDIITITGRTPDFELLQYTVSEVIIPEL
jgi:hypothetical protein